MLFTLFGDYIRHYGGTVWIGSLITLMAQLGFTSSAVRAAVSRTARQGWLLPMRAGRASYYALSARGQARVEEAAQRIFKLHPERWDGLWRVLIVPAPRAHGGRPPDPARRAALRRELAWMGFAPVSRGVYISPNDLLDRCAGLAERYDLAGQMETFTARHQGPSPDAALAARYWDLGAIDAAYARFVEEWRPRLEERRAAAAGAAIDEAVAFAEKTRLIHAFRKFLFIDPGLPQDLLPPRWSGTEAGAVFSGYYHLLAEGALRFFERHYRPAPGHEADVPEGRRAARRDPFRPILPVA
jgi:phenylacetic acid degradation operon negative regulatory protein